MVVLQKSFSKNVMCSIHLNLQEQMIELFGHLLQLTTNARGSPSGAIQCLP
jgi:hypothetical protein